MAEIVYLDGPGGAPTPRPAFAGAAGLLAIVVTALGLALFTAAALVLLLGTAGMAISLGPDAAYLGVPPDRADIVPLASLPAATRAAYAATFAMDTAPVLFIIAELRAWLRLIATGMLLGTRHGRHLERIACGLVAFAAAPPVGRLLVLLAGHGVDRAWFHASAVHALLLAGVLALLARAADAGHAAAQDRDGFV